VQIEKSVDDVRKNLMQFGAHKAGIFDDWLQEFDCRSR
jgi:hypothetical protein